jgi:hypothetical protein
MVITTIEMGKTTWWTLVTQWTTIGMCEKVNKNNEDLHQHNEHQQHDKHL